MVVHLLQGRFKAILVEKHYYLLQLCRYSVQNPVAAQLAQTPGEWPWSSLRTPAGRTSVPAWLTVDWIRDQVGENGDEARSRYREFVGDGIMDASP